MHTEPYLRLRYFCSPYHQDSALFPFIDQLGRAAGFATDDMPAAKLEKLEAVLALAAPPDEDVACCKASLPRCRRGRRARLSAPPRPRKPQSDENR
jgi:hypothetical protein